MDTEVLLLTSTSNENDKTKTTICSASNHIHLNLAQCNLLVVGYIRSIERKHQSMLISDDIYKECLGVFIKLISVKVNAFETGLVYQGSECQIEAMHFRSVAGKQPIHLECRIHREMNVDEHGYEWRNILNAEQISEYEEMFDQLPKISDGGVSALHILQLMRKSGLPANDLIAVWRMSSFSGQRTMAKEEFALNMYLCDMMASGQSVPTALKWNQVPPNKWNLYFGLIAFYWIDYKGREVKYKAGYDEDYNSFTQQTFTSPGSYSGLLSAAVFLFLLSRQL